MTRLTQIREATAAEKKDHGAEVVFTRKEGVCEFTIFGCQSYESWEQWGAPKDVLGDNVDDIEKWRRGDKLKGAVDSSDEITDEMVERLR